MTIRKKVIFTGTRIECRNEEIKLRPQTLMGWNIERGGRVYGDPDELCVVYWIYADDRHTNHEHEGYIGVTNDLERRWPEKDLPNFEAERKRKRKTAEDRGW
jgi:hypothetical protein